jgi:hypothetical protein
MYRRMQCDPLPPPGGSGLGRGVLPFQPRINILFQDGPIRVGIPGGKERMTDFQALELLRGAGIVGAHPLEDTARLVLSIRRGGTIQEVSLRDLRSEVQNELKRLDEEKQDVLRNLYAGRVLTTFSLGGGQPTTMEALKRNDQLTPEEQTDKVTRLSGIDAQAKDHRSLLLALTHFQVHSADLLPRLAPGPGKLQESEPERRAGKELWTKGVKSAALFCLREAQRTRADDSALMVLCRGFLERYEIDGDPDYTAETLFQNARQVRQLDILE